MVETLQAIPTKEAATPAAIVRRISAAGISRDCRETPPPTVNWRVFTGSRSGQQQTRADDNGYEQGSKRCSARLSRTVHEFSFPEYVSRHVCRSSHTIKCKVPTSSLHCQAFSGTCPKIPLHPPFVAFLITCIFPAISHRATHSQRSRTQFRDRFYLQATGKLELSAIHCCDHRATLLFSLRGRRGRTAASTPGMLLPPTSAR